MSESYNHTCDWCGEAVLNPTGHPGWIKISSMDFSLPLGVGDSPQLEHENRLDFCKVDCFVSYMGRSR